MSIIAALRCDGTLTTCRSPTPGGLYTYLYSGYAVFGMTSHIVCLNVQYLPSTLALLVYDWLLCLDYEARLIWNWHSRVAGSSLLYAFSRYAVLMSNFLSILTAYPLSDSVCSFPVTLILCTLIVASAEVYAHRLSLKELHTHTQCSGQLHCHRMDSDSVHDPRHNSIQWCVQTDSHSPHILKLNGHQPSPPCAHMPCRIETNGWLA